MINFKKEEIKSISHLSELNKISWQMTKWCNYRCEYCFQSKSYEKSLLSFDEYSKLADTLNKAIEKSDKDCALFLIGGEVTYINLIKLLKEHLNSKKIKEVHITTNLSRNEEWWSEFYNYCSNNNIKLNISASLHISQIKDFDEFIKKAINFASVVSVVINDENYEVVDKALKKLVSNGYNKKIFVNIDRGNTKENSTSKNVQEIANKYSKDSKQFKVILKSGETYNMSKDEIQIALNGDMNFSGFKCSTWVRYKNDGVIYRGSCKWKLNDVCGTDSVNYDQIICKSKNCPLCSVINIENVS